MALTYLDLQNEVKRRGTKNQGGTTFDSAIKNLINASLFRIATECPWRALRRKAQFQTVTSYKKATSAYLTSGSNIVTLVGTTLLTDDIAVERRIKFDTSSTYYYIKTINSETQITIDKAYTAVSATSTNIEILPQAEYNLPIQCSHRMFMWHEDYGFPFKMSYIPEQHFYEVAYYLTIKNVPTYYLMWGENMVIQQLTSASNITISSSSTLDTSVPVTVFGTVSGYPDYEVITTNSSDGTTAVTGTNLFTSVERIAKGATSTGRITATANGGEVTVAVMPTGDTTAGIAYRKVYLYPLPMRVHTVNVEYYKEPYRLVNDGDIHELGQAFDEAIILLATSKLKSESNQDEGDKFYALFQDELRTLRRTNMDKIDWFPNLQKPWYSDSRLLVHPNLLYGQIGAQFGPASRR